MDFRVFRRFVGRIDAGEVLQRAAERPRVEPLGVAPGAFLEGRVDEDLDELALGHQFARHAPLGAERRDEGNDDDQPGVGHQPRHFGDAADVLDAVLVGEAEIAVQPMANIVAVQDVGVAAGSVQLLLEKVGDRRLAGARQAR